MHESWCLAATQYNLQKQKDVARRPNFFYKEETKQKPLASVMEALEYQGGDLIDPTKESRYSVHYEKEEFTFFRAWLWFSIAGNLGVDALIQMCRCPWFRIHVHMHVFM